MLKEDHSDSDMVDLVKEMEILKEENKLLFNRKEQLEKANILVWTEKVCQV